MPSPARHVLWAVVAAIVLAALSWGTDTAANNTPFQFTVTRVIFYDDFEDDAVGSLPNGWVVHWGGSDYGVSTAHAYSGTKSLMLRGSYGWSCVLGRPFSSDARFIGFEVMLYITDPQTTDCPLTGCPDVPAGLGCYECLGQWGDNWIALFFNYSDNYVYVRDYWPNTDPSIRHHTRLVPFQRYTWMRLRVILDRDNALYYVWLNDNLIASGVPVVDYRGLNENTYLIDRFIAGSGWGGATIYIDDVKVFEASLPASTTTVSVTSTATYTATVTRSVTQTSTVTRTVTQTESVTVTHTTTATVTEERTVTVTDTVTDYMAATATQTVTERLTTTATLVSTSTVTTTETETVVSTATETVTRVSEEGVSTEALAVAAAVLAPGVAAYIISLRRR